jgi:hypothetical protein
MMHGLKCDPFNSFLLTSIPFFLEAAVANKNQLDQDKIVGYLNDIASIMKATQTELETIAKNPAGFVTGVLSLSTIVTTLGPFIQVRFVFY